MNENSNLIVHYLSLFFGFVYGLSFNEWIAFGNFLVVAFTLVFNIYVKRQQLKQLARDNCKSGINEEDEDHG